MGGLIAASFSFKKRLIKEKKESDKMNEQDMRKKIMVLISAEHLHAISEDYDQYYVISSGEGF